MYGDIDKRGSFDEHYPYSRTAYESKKWFCSYWHQIDEISSVEPKSVLEIGIGSGFTSRYLREKGVNITTLDIVCSLKPHIVGSVLEIPFADEVFDVVSCYEVLEHLPYSDFMQALREIHRVSQKRVALSLPDVTTIYRLIIELPRFKPIKTMIPHPFPRPTDHTYGAEHYWEIGKKNYPPQQDRK